MENERKNFKNIEVFYQLQVLISESSKLCWQAIESPNYKSTGFMSYDQKSSG